MTRTDIINAIARAYDHPSYLEIGVAGGANFAAVRCPTKVGVDPSASAVGVTHRMTSDQFFARNADAFDVIFIDGLHHCDQVDRDVENSLRCLRDGGTIVLHDCNPLREELQRTPQPQGQRDWTGDVWRSVARLRMTRPDLSVQVVDADWGCGIVRRGGQVLFPCQAPMTYEFLCRNRASLLNLISPRDWLATLADR